MADQQHQPLPTGLYHPYADCHTRIIDLLRLDLPQDGTDDEYRAIYERAISDGSEYGRTLQSAIESIKYGLAPPIAFPSETVYGLGHTATSTPAVRSIFATKGRPSDNPLIVHASSIAHLERLINGPLPEVYAPLVQRYWPGPMTILLPVPKDSMFSPSVHPGQRTIGFRIPSSKFARFFIAACDLPIAGPSANSSGKPSPTMARHVFDDLHGKINFILDGGTCDVGVESTVVDGLHAPPLILRPGGVSLAQLRALGGKWAKTALGYKRHPSSSAVSSAASTPKTVENTSGNKDLGTGGLKRKRVQDEHDDDEQHVVDVSGAPRAPGMKYRHYAPKGRLVLFSRSAVKNGCVREKLDELVAASTTLSSTEPKHLKVGIITRRWGSLAGLSKATAPRSQSSSTTDSPDQQVITATKLVRSEGDDWLQVAVTLYEADLGSAVAKLAHELFYVLRKFDDLDCDYIFAEAVDPAEEEGLNEVGDQERDKSAAVVDAVVDRIGKASSEFVDA
jgi:L-threonylcarbamoyladenylate synthase